MVCVHGNYNTFALANKIADISIPSIALSVGTGTLTRFAMVGNKSIVAANYRYNQI